MIRGQRRGALTSMKSGVKVMFVFVVGDVVKLVTGGAMVVFDDVIDGMVMFVTSVNGGVMVVYDDVVMLATSVNGGAMVLFGFVIADVAMLVIGEISSPVECGGNEQLPARGGCFSVASFVSPAMTTSAESGYFSVPAQFPAVGTRGAGSSELTALRGVDPLI
ncbi:hypothetical protein QYE76_029268 [Lolium multiflorum]|uniref:Uncharacterized protein n=1 Tax=Lolium multiflorum TaxID=4521 RepID=A0AAD8QMG5_LOLMU|nr:hypothetical protein QYE76_029268 [Lolium multiflorum]